MKRLQSAMAFGVESLGTTGVLGVGLLVFVAAFYFSTFRPEQARLQEMRNTISSLQERRAQVREEPVTSGEKLNAFYGFFPPAGRTADMLGKIFDAADRQSLKLEHGEYRAVSDNVGRLTHFQIILPVKGAYPQVRKFVAAALADVPNLSLDSIQFERQKVGESTVDAKVKLVLYLGQRS